MLRYINSSESHEEAMNYAIWHAGETTRRHRVIFNETRKVYEVYMDTEKSALVSTRMIDTSESTFDR